VKIVENSKAQSGKGYVYFANCETGFVKIGYTKRPENRLKQVSSAHHIKINDYFLVAGDRTLEMNLHKIFEKQRMYAEWFFLDYQELRSFIERYEYKYITDDGSAKKSLAHAIGSPYSRYYESFIEALTKDNEIESVLVAQQAHYCSLLKEMIDGRIEIEEEIVKEFCGVTLKYNDFLDNCNAPDEEGYEIIKENEKLIADVARIGYIIEVSDTAGKDDKQIYQMVKAWIDKTWTLNPQPVLSAKE